VLDNVLTGALPKLSTPRALFHLFPRHYQRKACDLLQQVGLSETHLYRRAMNLSGGQQQRVAIARAFLLDPTLVLADEPVASLDPSTSRTILSLLKAASRQRGTTVMCSLHQVELALDYADRIVAMRGGQVIFDGRPDDLSAEWQRTIYDRPAGAGSAPHNEVGERVDADEVSSSPRIPVLNR
jgi:phosphonate transport system ATP-binding protein